MSDKSEVDIFSRIGRAVLGRGLDRIIYAMLNLSFQIFFNIASAELFTGETIKNFVGRVQLVIGVFMMFKLAIAIVKGIVDPDSFMDKKNGVGNLVTRVIFALVMLTLIVPINIPNARNEYEVQLNNNGLLFGTLYSLQNRILSNNTLGHLILGTTNNNYSFTSETGKEKLEEIGNMITSTVLKAFININVKDENLPETDSSNWLCDDLDSQLVSTYTNPKSSSSEILDLTKETCDNSILPGQGEVYAFSYLYFASGIAGVIFVVLMVSFSIDVAKRAIKLAILRLIAPIPIISYIDPSTQKKSFDSWVSATVSTYIDLFVRLALVYFIVFLISDIVDNGLIIDEAGGVVGKLTVVFIFIGLFYFAKEAPKFFMDLFGVKSSGGKMLGGLGEILGVGATAVGSIGAITAGMRSSKMADQTRSAMGEKNIFGNPVNPNSFFNRAKHLASGIAAGATGFGAGATAAMSAKDHNARAAFEAIQKQNAQKLAAGDSGSTLFGRMGAIGSRAITGEAAGATIARQISSMESKKKALEAVKKRMSGEMPKANWTKGSLGIATDKNGNAIGDVNYKTFMAAKNAAVAAGASEVTFKDVSGADRTISMQDAYLQEGFLLKNNEDSYIQGAVKDVIDPATGNVTRKADGTLVNLIQDATAKGAAVSDRKSVTDAIDEFDKQITNAKRKNAVNEANDRFAGGKK